MNTNRINNAVILTLLSMGLAACGGGGGTVSTQSTGNNDLDAAALAAQVKQSKRHTVQNPEGLLADGYQITIDGKTYKVGEKVDISALPNGFSQHGYSIKDAAYLSDGVVHKEDYVGTLQVYQQPYSYVLGNLLRAQIRNNSGVEEPINQFTVDGVGGLATATDKIPKAGMFTYNGIAFTKGQQGQLSYAVNFDQSVGSGVITGLADTGKITLNEGRISNQSIGGINQVGVTATSISEKLGSGKYQLGFFGPNAEEIAGVVHHDQFIDKGATLPDDYDVGFAGQR